MKHILTILLLLLLHRSHAGTIVVGPTKSVTSLRAAVDMANDGDTILLQKGVYKEGNIIIKKSIRLIGVDEPIIDGEDKYEILTVSGEMIVIKGIYFRNAGYSSMNDYAAISLLDAQNVIIENNRIEHSYFAIHVANARDCIIRNNMIITTPKSEQLSGNGIHLWKCDNILVKSNEIQGHRDGIYFEFVTNSVIDQNFSHHNVRYGLHFMFSNNNAYMHNTFEDNGAGVAVMYSHHVLMLGNNFHHNWGASAYGILLKEISDAKIINNHFDRNTVGILMESTNRIDVIQNDFSNNGWAMRIQASCNENTVQQNDFTANTFDVATNGTTTLNRFFNNYWDRYDGYDLNKDNLGDVAYHPVSMYSMVVEQNPNSVILLRSFMVSLLDRAEKAIPSLTPENLTDESPVMKKNYQMIKIENVNKRFRKLQALSSINVEFDRGQVISLIGPNGSGKTTLIKSILGLVKPDNGVIYFDDTAISEDVRYRKNIGYMPQIGRYPDNMRIGQVFQMIKNLRGRDQKIDEELYYRFKLDTLLDKPMRSLSGGTRQKVSAALAFLFDPDVLILDEPTAGLDSLASEILKEKIIAEKAKGKLILITSHILSDLEDLTTHVLYLQEGRIVLNDTIGRLYEMTGEDKLSKAIACLMKSEAKKNEVHYLKIAN